MPTMEQVELIGVQLAVDLPPDTSGMVLVQVDAMGLAMGGGPGMDMGASMDMSTGMPGPTIAVTFCATLSVSSKMVYQVPVVPSLNATPGRCP